MPRPQGSALATSVLGAHISLADDDKKSAFNFSNDFDSGFLWAASPKEPTFLPNSCEMTMLGDSGAA